MAPEITSFHEHTDPHGAILSERNPETHWTTPTCWANEKMPTSHTLKWVDMVETFSHNKMLKQAQSHTVGRELPASLSGVKGLDPTSSTQLLRLQLWNKPPKYIALKTNGACIHETIAKQETVFDMLLNTCHCYPQCSAQKELVKLFISCLSLKKAYLHTLTAAWWGWGFELSTHLEADCDPLWRTGKPADNHLCLLTWAHHKSPIFSWKELVHTPDTPAFVAAAQRPGNGKSRWQYIPWIWCDETGTSPV